MPPPSVDDVAEKEDEEETLNFLDDDDEDTGDPEPEPPKRQVLVKPKRKPAPPSPEPEEEEDSFSTEPAKVEPKPIVAKVPAKKIDTIEDLYAVYPSIGDGEYRVRVERISPKAYGGQHIAGWITDLDKKITLEEIQTMFGGGHYNIIVLGPANGKADSRSLANLEITIPGPPLLNFMPQPEEAKMMNTRIPMQEPPNVLIKRMEIESRERDQVNSLQERLMQERMERNTTPDHVVRALTQQSDKTVTELKNLSEQQIQLLREQAHYLSSEVNRKEAELKSVRDQLVTERQNTVEARMKAEIEIERRLKESHDAVIQALTKKHEEALATLKDQAHREARELESRNRERMEEASRRYQEDMTRNSLNSTNEIERIRRDAERSEKNLKETYEARIADLQRSTEREIKSIVDQRDREIASLKLTYESTEKFAKQSSDLRVDTMKGELERLRTEAEALRRENEAMRKAQHKDPQAYLMETKQIAESLLGMVPRSEIPETPEEPEFDWKKEAAKGAIGLLQQAPAIVEKISAGMNQQKAVQAQQQAAMQQQQAMAAARQERMQAAQQRPGLPPGPGQQPRRRGVAPDAWSGSSGLLPVAEEIPFQPPQLAPQVPISMSQPTAVIAPEPMAVTVPLAQASVQEAEAVQPQEVSQSSEQEQLAQFANGFAEFISQLETSIRSEVVTPEVFAKGFVDRVGPQQAAMLLQQVPVQNFLESVEQQSGGATAIVTRDGKKYTRAVWAEAAKLLQG